MMYKVIETFRDTEHGGVYQKGDAYPAPGKETTPERIAYLSGSTNKMGKPVIEPVGSTGNRRRTGAFMPDVND